MYRALKYFVVVLLLFGSFLLIGEVLGDPGGVEQLLFACVFLTASLFFLSSYLACWLILTHDEMHAHITHDHLPGVQKVHGKSVPRIGGVALLFALLVGMPVLSHTFPRAHFGSLIGLLTLCSLPVFLGGFMEDLFANVSVKTRLTLSFISSGLLVLVAGIVVPTFNLPWLDQVVTGLPFALELFTVFAVAGVSHSFNLIDGFNGLASGLSLVVNSAVMYVAFAVGDHTVVMLSLLLNAGTLGFLVWNWPKGKIFLGDGGAYLLGFLTAGVLVLLVQRNPVVSSWLPLVLVGFPVFETLYSIYRRKRHTRKSPGAPDDLHIHQLVFRQVVKHRPKGYCKWLSSNSLTTLPILLAVGLVSTLAAHYYQDTTAQITICLVGVILYIGLYRYLASSCRGAIEST